MTEQLVRRRFSVEEYYRMAEAGILAPDERVELIEGDVIEMNPIGSPHAGCVKRSNKLFSRCLGDRALISVQDPVRLSKHSEPEPDLMLLRPRADSYAESHPEPGDVLLLLEVAWSSLGIDKNIKMPLYASHGIPEAWLADLDGGRLLVHRLPGPDGYGHLQILVRGQRIAPLAFPDVEVAVEELLG